MKAKRKDSGKLRIGDDWNAIRIIALSQSNPLKAIAEFVENSIDATSSSLNTRAPLCSKELPWIDLPEEPPKATQNFWHV